MNKYDNIINLPHYELKYHKRMPISSRAAQFSPYDALNGYSEEIKEAQRNIDIKRSLSNDEIEDINLKLQVILNNINSNIKVRILYFINDKLKYSKYIGIVSKIDLYNKIIIFKDKFKISICNIFSIDILDN